MHLRSRNVPSLEYFRCMYFLFFFLSFFYWDNDSVSRTYWVRLVIIRDVVLRMVFRLHVSL
jgi:hypothetical protein